MRGSGNIHGMDEATARATLLLAALDRAQPPVEAWNAARRAEVARHVRDAVPVDAPPTARLAARTDAALAKLLPADDPASIPARRWLARRTALAAWVATIAAAALFAGAAVDRIGSLDYIRLIEPAVWGVVAWNLVAYALLVVRAAARGGGAAPRGWLAALTERLRRHGRVVQPPPALVALVPPDTWTAFRHDWLMAGRPLIAARVGAVLHAAAAALATGIIIGLYVRGLVHDYAAGWESTFLDADDMQVLVGMLLGPAAFLSGLPLPDAAEIAALRVLPGGHGHGDGAAAVIIHLHAWTLLAAVVLPRALLAGLAAWRARRLSADFPLPADVLATALAPSAIPAAAHRYALWAHGAGVSDADTLRLASALGAGTPVAHASVAVGEEDDAPGLPTPEIGIVLVAMAATPETELHGRLLARLAATHPRARWMLVIDRSAYARRFAGLPARLVEREAAWGAFAVQRGLTMACVDLDVDIALAHAIAGAAQPPAGSDA